MHTPYKLFVVLFFIFLQIQTKGQQCCSDPNREFSKLGNIAGFKSEHELPAEISFQPMYGEMVTLGSGNSSARAFEIRNPNPTSHWLIVIHEWWGLNDHIIQESEKLYQDVGNINVLALDMYDGKVATTRDKAADYMQGLSKERAYEIIHAAFEHIGEANILTIGWCFGGGWSLQAAIEAGNNAIGCVVYYGMPEKNIERLAKLQCDVLGIFASRDSWISPKMVQDFESNMEKAEGRLLVHSYDADHAFANPSSPRYQEKEAQEAYKVTLRYLQEKIYN